ncbi:SRPBCC domain-containing protein [Alteromonas sp. ASW11-36]|uniref:SRPBCC domain-containing protein n=1 Tax=Alteromonas arenosi TaxID=3055817 RepID=A0ABT7T016_9ALTE|nr:SRPBCC domain-containing protein [Alteromonas sp. ASW11-36]MDM7861789.1 SRPBCC domain-containing protein [Alteromonas sp. ASW11-36]
MSQLSLTIHLNASTAEVFEAFALPEKLVQWFAPGQSVVAQVMSSFVEGGKYSLTMQEPSGQQFQLIGQYLNISENEHLRYSWAWADTAEESLITEVDVVFVAVDEETTELTLTHSGFANEAERDQHQHGWIDCLEKLSRLVLTETYA